MTDIYPSTSHVHKLCDLDANTVRTCDGMTVEQMRQVAGRWNIRWTFVHVNDILFEDGRPASFVQQQFMLKDRERFVEYMMDASLTHRLMFVEPSGCICITESKDGTTNIDADVIETLCSAFDVLETQGEAD